MPKMATQYASSSRHMEKTEAGKKGLCVWEIRLSINIITVTTLAFSAAKICYTTVRYFLIRPELMWVVFRSC